MQVVLSTEYRLEGESDMCVNNKGMKEEGRVRKMNWVWKEQALRWQIGTEMSCFGKTINQRSQNGRGHRLNSAHNRVLFGSHSVLKIGDFPLKKKNLGFHLLKTQKVWQPFSLPTGNHQLGRSRHRLPGESLISPFGYFAHQSPTIILHTLHVSLS